MALLDICWATVCGEVLKMTVCQQIAYCFNHMYLSCGEKDHNPFTPDNYSDLKTRLLALSTTEVSKEAR